jgi:hypothetical protein
MKRTKSVATCPVEPVSADTFNSVSTYAMGMRSLTDKTFAQEEPPAIESGQPSLSFPASRPRLEIHFKLQKCRIEGIKLTFVKNLVPNRLHQVLIPMV